MLTRMVGEKIWINENVCIEVVEIRRNRVRIGITAPESVAIHRDDPARRLRDNGQNNRASRSNKRDVEEENNADSKEADTSGRSREDNRETGG